MKEVAWYIASRPFVSTTLSQNRACPPALSLPQPISPPQTWTKSQLLKLSLVPTPRQMKSTAATVGYEVNFLCSVFRRWKPKLALFDYTRVLPLLAVCLWAGYLTLSFVSPAYGFNSIYFQGAGEKHKAGPLR